jgi:hypothetical protein
MQATRTEEVAIGDCLKNLIHNQTNKQGTSGRRALLKEFNTQPNKQTRNK